MMNKAAFKLNAQKANPVSKNKPQNGYFFKPVIQAKLSVNQSNDIYEQEADAVADKVMRMPASSDNKLFFQPNAISVTSVQRKCSSCEQEDMLQLPEDDEEILQRKYSVCEGQENDIGQMKTDLNDNGGVTAPSIVNDVLNTPGQAMNKDTRNFMESRFGYDFGDVKIHNDSLAHRSSAAINALAYTNGNHVVFGSGAYRPDNTMGKELLAHELTHVVQQQGFAAGAVMRRKQSNGDYENACVIVKEIFNPKTETIAFFDSANNKCWQTQVTFNGQPRPGIYNYTNGKTTQSLNPIKTTDKNMVLTWSKYPEGVTRSLDYQLKVLDTRIYQKDGYEVSLSELEEITEYSQDLDDNEIEQLKKKRGKWPKSYKDIIKAIKDFKVEKLEEEISALDTASIEVKIYGAEHAYNLYKFYKFSQKPLEANENYNYDSIKDTKLDNDTDLKTQLGNEIKSLGITDKDDFAGQIKDFESLIEQLIGKFTVQSQSIAYLALDEYKQKLRDEMDRYRNRDVAKSLFHELDEARSWNAAAESELGSAMADTTIEAYEDFGGYYSGIKVNHSGSKMHLENYKVFSKNSYDAYSKVVKDHPALLTMKMTEVLNESEYHFTSDSNYFLNDIGKIINSIDSTKERIKEKPEYVYKLDNLIQLVYQTKGIDPYSIIDLVVRDKMKRVSNDSSFWQTALTILSIAVIIATGGAGLLALGANLLLAGLGVVSAVESIDNYIQDKEALQSGLSSHDPSVFWVAVAVIGAGLDIGSAATAFAKTARLAEELSISGDLQKFSDDIDKLDIVDASSGLANFKALNIKIRAVLKAKAAAQLELDEAFKQFAKTAGRAYSMPLLDPEILKNLAKLSAKAVKFGYYRFEEFILLLKRTKALGEIDFNALSPDEMKNLKGVFEDGLQASKRELAAEKSFRISEDVDDMRSAVDDGGSVPIKGADETPKIEAAASKAAALEATKGRGMLLHLAEQAGVRSEIAEGRIAVFLHGTSEEAAMTMVREPGSFLTSSGGSHGGKFFATTDLDVAEHFAARRVTGAGSSGRVVGIVLEQETLDLLQARKLIKTVQISDRAAREVIFEPGAIEILSSEGFFFLVVP